MSNFGIYSQYLESENFGIVDQPKLACILHLAISMLLFSLCYFFGKKDDDSYKNEIILKLMMCGSVFWALSVNFTTIGRIALYFDAFSIILVPNVLKNLRIESNKKIILTALLILFVSKYFVIAYLRPEWFGIYPYEFYFDH